MNACGLSFTSDLSPAWPPAPVDPEDHGEVLRVGGGVHVQRPLLVLDAGVGDVALDGLGVRRGGEGDEHDEQGEAFHNVELSCCASGSSTPSQPPSGSSQLPRPLRADAQRGSDSKHRRRARAQPADACYEKRWTVNGTARNARNE